MANLNSPPSTAPSPSRPFGCDPDPRHRPIHLNDGHCIGADLCGGELVDEDNDKPMEMPTRIMGIDVDPVAGLIPGPTRKEYQRLKNDIIIRGLRVPAIRVRGKVADGRCRLMIAGDLGITPAIIDLPDDTDTLALVMSFNAHRRHLSKSQLAMLIIAGKEWAQSGHNQHSGGEEPGSTPATNEDMAKSAGVSVKTIQQAKVVHGAGLGQRVMSGELTVKAAATLAKQSGPTSQVISSEKRSGSCSNKKPKKKLPEDVMELHRLISLREEEIHELTDALEQEQETTKSLKARCTELEMKIAKLECKAHLPCRETAAPDPNGSLPALGEASTVASGVEHQVVETTERCSVIDFVSAISQEVSCE